MAMSQYTPSVRIVKQDFPRCWEYLMQCADSAGAYAGQLVALRFALDSYDRCPRNYKEWAAADLVQEHFRAFISSFPLTVSGFLGGDAAHAASELAEGSEAAKRWLAEHAMSDSGGWREWSTFVDERCVC